MSSISPSCFMCMKTLTDVYSSYEADEIFCSHVCHNIFLLNITSNKKSKTENKEEPKIPTPPSPNRILDPLPSTIISNINPLHAKGGRVSAIAKILSNEKK